MVMFAVVCFLGAAWLIGLLITDSGTPDDPCGIQEEAANRSARGASANARSHVDNPGGQSGGVDVETQRNVAFVRERLLGKWAHANADRQIQDLPTMVRSTRDLASKMDKAGHYARARELNALANELPAMVRGESSRGHEWAEHIINGAYEAMGYERPEGSDIPDSSRGRDGNTITMEGLANGESMWK